MAVRKHARSQFPHFFSKFNRPQIAASAECSVADRRHRIRNRYALQRSTSAKRIVVNILHITGNLHLHQLSMACKRFFSNMFHRRGNRHGASRACILYQCISLHLEIRRRSGSCLHIRQRKPGGCRCNTQQQHTSQNPYFSNHRLPL